MLTQKEINNIVEPIQNVIDHLVKRIETLEAQVASKEAPKKKAA